MDYCIMYIYFLCVIHHFILHYTHTLLLLFYETHIHTLIHSFITYILHILCYSCPSNTKVDSLYVFSHMYIYIYFF